MACISFLVPMLVLCIFVDSWIIKVKEVEVKQKYRVLIEVELDICNTSVGSNFILAKLEESINEAMPVLVYDDDELDSQAFVDSWTIEINEVS